MTLEIDVVCLKTCPMDAHGYFNFGGAVAYERVPARLQASVLGAFRASAWIGIPFGALLGGALTEWIGLRDALLVTGTAMFLTTLAPFVFPSWRGMNRRPRPLPSGEPAAVAH